MNSNQIASLVRLILNFVSGAIIAWSASHTQPAKDLSAFIVQFINGPDMFALATTGVMWLWGHLSHSATPPPASPPSTPPLPLLIAIGAAALFMTGCVPLKPGARAVVVRAEQSITVANATFDSAVHIDDANRSFFRTNAPAFHQFCEWLRVPVVMVPLTNSLPRGLAIVASADAVKETYKATNTTNAYAALINSLAIVESATSQAQKFILETSTKH